jgi:protein O-GlcNAc transferase
MSELDDLNNRAVLAHRAGDAVSAEAHFHRALQLDDGAAVLHFNYANLLRDMGRKDDAAGHYRAAIERDPAHAAAHNNLGNLLKDLKRWDEAAHCYRAAIAADPSYAPAHRNLADIDEGAGRAEAAIAGFGAAIRLRGDAGSRIRDALVLPVIAQSVGEIDDYRGRMAEKLAALAADAIKLNNPLTEVGATPFNLAYHGRDDRALMEALAKLYRQGCPSLSVEAPHVAGWLGGMEGGRIRIGFASRFLHEHTIARLNENLIAKLPRDRFEVHLFDRLPHDLDAARAQIAKSELDVLYFTDIGMEPLSYFLAFARLAPIQCATWGHPDTTGIDTVDYFLSSALYEANGAEAHYRERLIRFEGPSVSVSAPAVGTAEPGRGPTFLCPQTLFKFHPDFDPLIARILEACPEAELALLEGNRPEWRDALVRRWKRAMPHVVDRIRFLPRRDRAGFMALLASTRVALDTPHFSGGLTSFETLAVGTPVVSLPSSFTRGRLTLGLYRRMGLMDLVAQDADHYVELAVRLAKDDAFHHDMTGRIRALAPKLIDDPQPIAEHAAFFEKAMYGFR